MSNSWSSLNIWSNYVHTATVFGDVFIVRQASRHLSNIILSRNLNSSLQSCSIEQVNWLINSFPESITGIPSILPVLVEHYIMMYIYVNLVLLSKIVSNIGVRWDDLGNIHFSICTFSGAVRCAFVFSSFFPGRIWCCLYWCDHGSWVWDLALLYFRVLRLKCQPPGLLLRASGLLGWKLSSHRQVCGSQWLCLFLTQFLCKCSGDHCRVSLFVTTVCSWGCLPDFLCFWVSLNKDLICLTSGSSCADVGWIDGHGNLQNQLFLHQLSWNFSSDLMNLN